MAGLSSGPSNLVSMFPSLYGQVFWSFKVFGICLKFEGSLFKYCLIESFVTIWIFNTICVVAIWVFHNSSFVITHQNNNSRNKTCYQFFKTLLPTTFFIEKKNFFSLKKFKFFFWKTQKLKSWQFRTEIMTNQKLKLWQIQNLNCDNSKTQIRRKL